ncbi:MULTISPECIES: hypothetical protein [unclassified Nocardia]|uniref:hypothetical protein n=1 Tax=unclassified Nocardia TaxID=2637762 RepID=UPI001CE3C357|nr:MULTISPECIES: hypothetical protein [unclassified Nocardia]
MAAVLTYFDGVRRRFGLPGDAEEFRAWMVMCRACAQDKNAFDLHHDIVMEYVSRISEARAQGMYPLIMWSDQPDAPVSVAHHQIAALYRDLQLRTQRR